jgi:single-stranded DNA-binding protein
MNTVIAGEARQSLAKSVSTGVDGRAQTRGIESRDSEKQPRK